MIFLKQFLIIPLILSFLMPFNILSNENITNEEIIEYVVLHEMCHLIYMNHSKEFWNLVGKYIKDYKKVDPA